MESQASGDEPTTLHDLLVEALDRIVFGNGFLAIAILAVFVLAVMLSRILKGGSL